MSLTDNLVGLWRMNESVWNGTTGEVKDTVGTADGKSYGAVITTGKLNNGGSWDGTDDYVSLDTSETYYTSISDTFTVAFWANPLSTRPVTAEANSGISGTSGQRYAIYPAHGGPEACAGVSVGTNGISVFEHGSNYLPSLLVYNTTISGWVHVVVVYQSKTPTLYLNGSFAKTGLTSLKAVHPPKNIFGGNIYGWYHGYLDEAAVWGRALAGDEISYLYNGGAGREIGVVRVAGRRSVFTLDTERRAFALAGARRTMVLYSGRGGFTLDDASRTMRLDTERRIFRV